MPKTSGIVLECVAANGGEYVGPATAVCAYPGKVQAAENPTRHAEKTTVRCFMMAPLLAQNGNCLEFRRTRNHVFKFANSSDGGSSTFALCLHVCRLQMTVILLATANRRAGYREILADEVCSVELSVSGLCKR
jgi:hypothetical protein